MDTGRGLYPNPLLLQAVFPFPSCSAAAVISHAMLLETRMLTVAKRTLIRLGLFSRMLWIGNISHNSLLWTIMTTSTSGSAPSSGQNYLPIKCISA